MSAGDPHTVLASAMHTLLRQLESPLVNGFLPSWPDPPRAARQSMPTSLPVVRWIRAALANSPPFATRFVVQLVEAAGGLAWRRSYDDSQTGTAFWERYGYCEIVGPGSPVASMRLAAGVLLLAPHTEYPAHWHEAEEIYVPLAGTARWWQGVQPWTVRRPGEVIRHAHHEPHAMRTADEPLLAIYLWHSADLAQKSLLVSSPPRRDPSATR